MTDNIIYNEAAADKQIILLNGASSSGKSTLARALQELIKAKRNERYEIVSIDDFLKMTSEDVIYEDDVFEISLKLCEKVTEVIKTASGVIIDHVITSERIFNQLRQIRHRYPIYMIQTVCPLEELIRREQIRRNRCIGSAEASYNYLFPKDGYDLSVNTHTMSASDCAAVIYEKLFYNRDLL